MNPEVKLIYFDSAFYIPQPEPFTYIEWSDADTKCDRVDVDRIRRALRETNRDELTRSVKSVPTVCSLCVLNLPTIRDIVGHVFSQPHLDKHIQVRGSISSRDFSFWMRRLKIFSKDRTSKSIQRELRNMSMVLDLHSQRTHWTVEVSSASEHELALQHFISACLSQSERILLILSEKKEAERVRGSLLKKFPRVNASKGILQVHDKLCFLYIEELKPPKHDSHAVVFLRPPGVGEKWLNDVTIADTLCSDPPASLMLINGSEERDAFRAFEKKFMQSEETPLLPIHGVTALRNLAERARVEFEKHTTVDQSIFVPPPVADSIAGTSEARFNTQTKESVGVRETTIRTPKLAFIRDQGEAEKTTESAESTVSTVTTTVSWEQRAKMNNKKPVVRKGKRYHGEVKKTDPDEWMEHIPEVGESEVTEWPTIFTPFDEETGKAVGEMIRRLSESSC